MGQHLPQHGQSGDLHAAALLVLRVPASRQETQELPARREKRRSQVCVLSLFGLGFILKHAAQPSGVSSEWATK